MKKQVKENYDLKFVGNDDALKSKIQQILTTYDSRIQQLVLDALEILKKNTSYYSANRQGLSTSQWASILEVAFKRLYHTIGGTEVKSYADRINSAVDIQFFSKIVEDVARKFTCCVKPSTVEGRYVWSTATTNKSYESARVETTTSGNIATGPAAGKTMVRRDSSGVPSARSFKKGHIAKNALDTNRIFGENTVKRKQTNEALADLAPATDMDHEVQMARAELYRIAEYAIKLHNLLKNVSEEEGLEGWIQSKITLAADYIDTVYHHLEYQAAEAAQSSPVRMPAAEGIDPYKDQLRAKLEEKAKSKAQQRFMGMVYAAKKGKKPASKEVAKVAKGMSKKSAKDFAATKHKGKPEHVKKDK